MLPEGPAPTTNYQKPVGIEYSQNNNGQLPYSNQMQYNNINSKDPIIERMEKLEQERIMREKDEKIRQLENENLKN